MGSKMNLIYFLMTDRKSGYISYYLFLSALLSKYTLPLS